MENDHLATPSEACREYARNVGAEDPDTEWILSPWDSWERNPFYCGAPGPHPEDDQSMNLDPYVPEDDEELDRLTAPRLPENDEDVPF